VSTLKFRSQSGLILGLFDLVERVFLDQYREVGTDMPSAGMDWSMRTTRLIFWAGTFQLQVLRILGKAARCHLDSGRAFEHNRCAASMGIGYGNATPDTSSFCAYDKIKSFSRFNFTKSDFKGFGHNPGTTATPRACGRFAALIVVNRFWNPHDLLRKFGRSRPDRHVLFHSTGCRL